jgi:hypothetical protein
LPVVVSGGQPIVAPRLELDANGIRIRVEVGTDLQYVVALVNALRVSC